MLRILLGLTFVLTLNDTCRSQETVITRDHSCEGESPLAVEFLSLRKRLAAQHFRSVSGRAAEIEDVPILLDNEKALTERLS